MFNIGAGEMVLIAVAALLILGPKRLPELARGLGKFMREFRRQTDEVRNVVEREFYSLDQEVQQPMPPVRPGSPFAGTPPPASVALPEVPVLPPPDAANAVVPPVPDAATVPAPASGTQVLELDAAGPRAVEPAQLHESPEPAPPVPVALTPDTPVPVPGTVARNAPKRS